MSYRVKAGELPELTGRESEEVRQVLEDVAVVLGVHRGSCPNYRTFGIATEILDRPVNVARTLLLSRVTEAVEEFVPKAKVNSVQVEIDPQEPGRLIPTVEVEIIEES